MLIRERAITAKLLESKVLSTQTELKAITSEIFHEDWKFQTKNFRVFMDYYDCGRWVMTLTAD